MKESPQLTEFFPVTPLELYNAWLDSNKHTAMTGGEADVSTTIGDDFSAWDGYIWGKNIELLEGEKIVQTWRTTEFAEDDDDSQLEIIFKPTAKGTELTLIHTHIPQGQTQYYQGWIDHYFTPMKEYFG